MKTYKVEVTEYGEKKEEDDRYQLGRTIYAQTFDYLDLQALIAVANRLVRPEESP